MSDLGDLGLSSYEEAAYRALLQLGRAPASEVAETGDVPQGRVYDVLNGLASRDLVRVHRSSDPRRYAAVDPETAVDRLLAERERELAAERERYADLAEAARTELSETLPVEGQFWEVGLGADDAVAAMREQFDRAEDRLLSVVGPPYGESDPEALRRETDAYAELVAGDVDAKLLTTPAIVEASPVSGLDDALDTEGFAVRTTSEVGLTFDVLDGEEVYLGVPAPFEAGERVGAVVVRDADFARRMEDRFESAWERASPVESVVR
jgi:sugar-specific transcriptional regulator TrmB